MLSTTTPKWKASRNAELNRLSSSGGWSLADSSSSSYSTSTRASNKRIKVDFDMSAVSSSPSTPLRPVALLEDGEGSISGASGKSPKKPPATRLLMEAPLMKAMIERHTFCPKCNAAVTVSFPTVCIASGCRIQCSDAMCNFVDTERPATAAVPLPIGSSPLYERITDYAANIQWVLAFMASGDGGKEAERLLGMLGLPNSTTMENMVFAVVQCRYIFGCLYVLFYLF